MCGLLAALLPCYLAYRMNEQMSQHNLIKYELKDDWNKRAMTVSYLQCIH